MDDDAPPENSARAATNRQPPQTRRQASLARGIRHQRWHVATVVIGVVGMTVRLTRRVEVPTGTGSIRRSAIAFFVNVEAVRPRSETGNLRRDHHRIALLAKRNHPGNAAALRRFQHRLGARPLGAALFSDPAIARLPLACRRLDGRDARYHRAAAALARQSPAPALPAALWARRSVFLLRGRALMVSEAFLPAILELRK